MERKPKVVYKYKNIAAALAILLLIIVGINTHLGDKKPKKTLKNTEETSSSAQAESEAEPDTPRLTKNYKYEEFKNGSSLCSGRLQVVNEDHPYAGTPSDTDGIYLYLFDGSKNQIMYASTTMLEAEAETLYQFNKMAVDFVGKTGLRTLMVKGLIPDSSEDGAKYDEASMGTCIDLMLYDAYAGTFSEFSVEGEYSWLAEHCDEYGFVFRGKDRLRYVGKTLAEYMKSANISLDDFITSVKTYSFESPLLYTNDELEDHAIYFVPMADGVNTSVPVPLRSDDEEYGYTISGNNEDGYIVVVSLSGNESFDQYYEKTDESSGAEDVAVY